MDATRIEKRIADFYANCHMPVRCKSNIYVDSASGRKIDKTVLLEHRKMKYLPGKKQYVNQLLAKPLYHEFIWYEDDAIHHKVIKAVKVNKCGLNWETVYHARFKKYFRRPIVEGEGTPEYWLDSDRDNMFDKSQHNWLNCSMRILAEDECPDEATEAFQMQGPLFLIEDKCVDISYYCNTSASPKPCIVFRYPQKQRAALRSWLMGEYGRIERESYEYYGLKSRRFGVELEFTGISRDSAARAVSKVLDNTKEYMGGIYNEHHIHDGRNRLWKIVRDGSIDPSDTANHRAPKLNHYKCELVTPILEYKDIPILVNIIKEFRARGAVVNESCGMHVHVDVRDIDAIQLRNIINITAYREELLCKALDVSERRIGRWCRKADADFVSELDCLPKDKISISAIKKIWYGFSSESFYVRHYDISRYHILNLHSFFEGKGIEFRLFNATLNPVEMRAYIILALSICCYGCTLSRTYRSDRRYLDTFDRQTMITWLYQLGLKGDEFKGVRKQLSKHLKKGKRVA